MKLISLNIKQFRNLKNVSINFKKGISLFTGNNGNGKSSILYALSLLLLDHTIEKLEDYIPWDSTYFDISIEFEHLNKIFKESIFYDGTTKKELYIDNEFYRNSDASKQLSEYFDPKLSLASIISFEGSIDLIKTKPSERREMLKKIYNLDFKKGADDLDLQIKEVEKSEIELDKQIYLLENKKYDLKDLYKQEVTEIEYDEISKRNTSISLIVSNYEKEVDYYNEKTSELNDFIAEKASKDLKLEKINNDLLDKLNNLKSEKENHLNKLIEYSTTLNKLTLEKNKTNFDVEANRIQNEINNLSVPSRIKDFDDKELSKLKEELTTIKCDIKVLENNLQLVISGKCPTCGQDYPSDKKEYYIDEINRLSNVAETISNQIIDLELKKVDIDKKKEDNKLLTENRNKLENDLLKETNLISSKKKELENDLLKTNELIINENKFFDLTEKSINESIKNINREKADINELLLQLEQRIIKLGNLKEPIIDEKIKIEFEKCLRIIKEFEKINSLNVEIELSNKAIDLVKEKELIELSDLKSKKESMIEDVELMKKGKIILQKEFPNYVLSHLVKSIEVKLNEFIEKTYNGRYVLKIKEEKDSIYVTYGPKEKDCKIASGYEQQIFSIAWKFALGSINNYGIIILDEIDSAASVENSNILYNVIGNMKELYNQIIIISHKEDIQGMLESNYGAVIYTIENGEIK